MSLYHIAVELSNGWYCVHALEDSGIYTQGKTLDEAIANVREVIELVRNDTSPELEVILPSQLQIPARKQRAPATRSRSRGSRVLGVRR